MAHRPTLYRVISGGQTGVDRAALDAAMESGIPTSGFCPAGRLAEDGQIPKRYRLHELATVNYRERTVENVKSANATLILSPEPLRGGTALTRRYAEEYKASRLVQDPRWPEASTRIFTWLATLMEKRKYLVLNVAGPRGSKMPWIYEVARECLLDVFRLMRKTDVRFGPDVPPDQLSQWEEEHA